MARSSSSRISSICIRSSDRPAGRCALAGLLLFPLFFAGGVFVSLPASASAANRQASAHRDGVYPGGILGAAGEFGPIEEQPHEDFLGRVVGVLLVAEQAIADSPHALAKSLHQRHERRTIGALAGSLGGQLLVGSFGDFQLEYPETSMARIGPRPCDLRKIGCRRSVAGSQKYRGPRNPLLAMAKNAENPGFSGPADEMGPQPYSTVKISRCRPSEQERRECYPLEAKRLQRPENIGPKAAYTRDIKNRKRADRNRKRAAARHHFSPNCSPLDGPPMPPLSGTLRFLARPAALRARPLRLRLCRPARPWPPGL